MLRFRWGCGVLLVLSALSAGCGGSSDGDRDSGRAPAPAPEVELTQDERDEWASAPTDRSSVPVLLYHGVAEESGFSDEGDAEYGLNPEDFAKQMTFLKHAGYQTISLDEFERFERGEPVDLPEHPLLLTFDDGRADSWTNADGILEELGFDPVMFVDVGAVDRGDPEYLTWEELGTMHESGRWDLQLHSGEGHHRIQYGPGAEDLGPFYAYRESGESFDGWRNRVFGDLEWGRRQLDEHVPGLQPLAFAPPYGSYGQDGNNDKRIPDELLGWLLERYPIVFTQDRDFLVEPGAEQPLGRLQLTRAITGGQLRAALESGRAP